ncbi:MAG: hypothetical protein VX675_05135, partial [Planctomycetota bacterium]|nr:hypothetical protein [Planctomycetota bacterium]
MKQGVLSILGLLLALVPLQAEERFDYHSIRKQPVLAAGGIYEGESQLRFGGKARVQDMRGFGQGWRGGSHLLWDGVVGQGNTVGFEVAKTGRYSLAIQWTLAPDYGVFEVRLNGRVIIPQVDLYSPRVELAKLQEVGEVRLSAGIQRLTIKLTGGNPKASKYQGKGYLWGLDYLKLTDLEPEPGKPAVEKPVLAHVSLEEALPLMKKYCFGCHGAAEKVKGKVNLVKLPARGDFLAKVELSRTAAKVLGKAEMPPEKEKQPTKAERATLRRFFDGVVEEYVQKNTTLEP